MERLEAIILAGGLGTRLRGVIGGGTPKCMAPVAGQPFLQHLFTYLERQNCKRVVLSLGHGNDVIRQWLTDSAKTTIEIDWVIEDEPLGTGGGIRLAMQHCSEAQVAVINGDTMFNIDLEAMMLLQEQAGAETMLALKALTNFERYGTVQKNARNIITAFQEKMPCGHGLINGGIYIINRDAFLNRSLPQKFSFEKDYLERFVDEGKFYGHEDPGYFIDIGVPEDYARAQTDFQSLFS